MKKKNFLFLILITVLFFVGRNNVYAKAYACKTSDCKEEIESLSSKIDESVKLVCSYAIENDGKYYANLIFLNTADNSFYASSTVFGKGNEFAGTFSTTKSPFIDSDALSNLKSMNRCPRYGYVDLKNINEICFDSNGETCKSKNTTTKKFGTKENSTLIDDKVSQYKGNDNTYNGSCNKDNRLTKEYGNMCRYLSTDLNTADYVLVYYNSSSSKIAINNSTVNSIITIETGQTGSMTYNYWGSYLYNYTNRIGGLNSCPAEIYGLEIYQTVSDPSGMGATSTMYSTYIYTNESEISDIKTSVLQVSSQKTYTLNQCPNESEVKPTTPEKKGCELIPSTIIGYINDAMSYIRIGVPILLGGLVIFDFASALFASSEDKMKKAQSKAIKRIIITIIIFFVPTLINLIFNIVNDVWSNANYEICGLDK